MAEAGALAQTLASQFAGDILTATLAGYDDARRVHNGLIDRRPGIIARCRGTADVQAAVRLAVEHEFPLAVRGGGHNVAGHAVCDGGLMIDLSGMRGVHVDASARLARAQGGALWGDYNRETQLHGLASTGGVISSTGVGGLTLGGGLGWLMGTQGLAIDNLRAVELVDATGDVRRVSAESDPDLFWALRGGGGNFGVATWLEFGLHRVGPTVLGGLIAYPFAAARDVLRHYRDFTAALPDEMTAFAGLVHAAGTDTKLVAIIVCYAGEVTAGERVVAPIKRFGTPALDAIAPMPYSAVNGMLDAGFPKGALNYWKASFLHGLSDEVIDTMIDRYAECPSAMSAILIEHFHGAATRVSPTATAFPHRAVGYNLVVLGEWTAPDDSERNIAWTRTSHQAFTSSFSGGRYSNYLNADEAGDTGAAAAAFGPNYERLRDLKRRYDPTNVFHRNMNIEP